MAVPEPWWIGVDDDVDRLWRAGSETAKVFRVAGDPGPL
jgi:hypothetical protein